MRRGHLISEEGVRDGVSGVMSADEKQQRRRALHLRRAGGYEFALRGGAKEAERALDEACLRRFGTLRLAEQRLVTRSDSGLIFQSRRFREASRFCRLKQEYITPYTPEQNGLIERFFRSLKSALLDYPQPAGAGQRC
jgi:hypothetical protein